jgi:hypothetical protein
MDTRVFDNVTEIIRDDMATTITKGSKVSIAAACFSMYAYKELKTQLEQVEECRFIFTSPTCTKEKAEKQKRQELQILLRGGKLWEAKIDERD